MHSHIGHIYMVFLRYAVEYVLSILLLYKIVCRSIHKRVAEYQDGKVHDHAAHLHKCCPNFPKKG